METVEATRQSQFGNCLTLSKALSLSLSLLHFLWHFGTATKLLLPNQKVKTSTHFNFNMHKHSVDRN